MRLIAPIASVLFACASISAPAFAEHHAKFQANGDETNVGYGDGTWFVADSFSFGVEREMKESGEKAGTLILTLNKDFKGRAALQRYHKSGEPIPSLTLAVPRRSADGRTVYLKYKLERCFVKSWSTSGDADDRPTEEVAFYYNKIAFAYAQTKDGKEFDASRPMAWDNVTNKKWD